MMSHRDQKNKKQRQERRGEKKQNQGQKTASLAGMRQGPGPGSPRAQPPSGLILWLGGGHVGEPQAPALMPPHAAASADAPSPFPNTHLLS